MPYIVRCSASFRAVYSYAAVDPGSSIETQEISFVTISSVTYLTHAKLLLRSDIRSSICYYTVKHAPSSLFQNCAENHRSHRSAQLIPTLMGKKVAPPRQPGLHFRACFGSFFQECHHHSVGFFVSSDGGSTPG